MERTSRVGILLTSPPGDLQAQYITPFEQALTGLVEARGDSVEFLRAYATRHLTDANDIARQAQSLIACRPDVIWLISTANAEAALKATDSIPVVGSAVNLENSALLKARAKAGGNFAGVLSVGSALGEKRFDFLRQILANRRTDDVPKVGVLVKLDHQASQNEFEKIKARAANKVQVKRIDVGDAGQLPAALENARKAQLHALMTTHVPFFQNRRAHILQFFAEQARPIPVVGHRTFFVEDGALLAYSSDLNEQMRRSAELVAVILRGSGIKALDERKIARLQKTDRFELAINLETAKLHGLTVPEKLLKQADRLIVNCSSTEGSPATPTERRRS